MFAVFAVVSSLKQSVHPSKVESTKAMNACVSALYGNGFWIPSADARVIANQGMVFLQGYEKCINLAYARKLNRFTIMPKLHMLHHTFLNMLQQADTSDWVLNPLAESVQMDEDFIGRPSRISRRVNIRLAPLRTLQRYLIGVRIAFSDLGH